MHRAVIIAAPIPVPVVGEIHMGAIANRSVCNWTDFVPARPTFFGQPWMGVLPPGNLRMGAVPNPLRPGVSSPIVNFSYVDYDPRLLIVGPRYWITITELPPLRVPEITNTSTLGSLTITEASEDTLTVPRITNASVLEAFTISVVTVGYLRVTATITNSSTLGAMTIGDASTDGDEMIAGDAIGTELI